ncbi:putative DNA replication complex GINS protein PSF2 isoform 2-T4 [Cochliomyia hominivorax]
MPSEHYMIEAQLIMSTAPDDVPRCEEIPTVIKDIFDIRESKLRTSIDAFIKDNL